MFVELALTISSSALTSVLVDEKLNVLKVLIVSVTARDSASATGQLIETLFEILEPITTLSLHAGHPSADQRHPQLLFKRNRLYSVYKAVKEFNPDVFYVRPALKPLSFNLFAFFMILALGSRVILHVMDDEANDKTNGGFFSRFSFSCYLRWLIRRADKIFTISPAMSEAFSERYGCDSQPLSNIPSVRPPTEISRIQRSEKVKIGYFGSLDVRMNLRCVEEICTVVDKLNNAELSIDLDIFTRPMYQAWADAKFRFKYTKLNTYVAPEEYLDTLRAYDVLLIAYNFDPVSIEYCKFSIANKLADYLSVGVPVLVVGPAEIETVAHCKQHEIGTTISKGYPTLEQDILGYVSMLRSGEVTRPGMWERHREALRLDFAVNEWRSAFRMADST